MATLVSVEQLGKSPRGPVEIEVPALTAWPLVLAFGFLACNSSLPKAIRALHLPY